MGQPRLPRRRGGRRLRTDARADRATDFLREQRGVLTRPSRAQPTARRGARRAGVLAYFADFAQHAGALPDYADPPRPALNRPFPPA
jgi:hypothetical protein